MATILYTYTIQQWSAPLRLPLQLQQLRSYIGTSFTEKGNRTTEVATLGAAACGPIMMLGIEFGWIFSCSGRQPWTIYGMQRTVDASTRADFVGPLFVLFIILYIGLAILTVIVLRTFFRRHPLKNDLQHQGGDSHA